MDQQQTNPTYLKLLAIMDDAVDPWMDKVLDNPEYNPDNRISKAILDAVWPEIEKLHAIAMGINLTNEKIYCEHWPIVGNQCWCQLVREHQSE